MLPFLESLIQQITPNALLDVGITALFIYWLFSLIRGTRAVTLVIGVSVLLGIYALAQFLGLRLFTQILQAGAFVGVFALVVVFQPELRRALERIGRVGTFGWLVPASSHRRVEHVATVIARAAAALSAEGYGALIVIERETGLEDTAETGVMLHADMTPELLLTIFMRGTSLHDGAVIIRGETVLAAAALLPLTEMRLSERFGTRHRAALGITEDTDAVAIVVSEESGQMSVVERARIVRVPTEVLLERALVGLLESSDVTGGLGLGRGGGTGKPRRPGTRLRISRRPSGRPETLLTGEAAGDGASADRALVSETQDGAAAADRALVSETQDGAASADRALVSETQDGAASADRALVSETQDGAASADRALVSETQDGAASADRALVSETQDGAASADSSTVRYATDDDGGDVANDGTAAAS